MNTNGLSNTNPWEWPWQLAQPFSDPVTTGTVTFYHPPPTECSDDVHVFPCKKCGECKCGKAKLAKKR